MPIQTFSMTLLDAYFLSPGIKHFIFQMDAPFSYTAGQFITIHFSHENQTLKRSYSIANAPCAKNQVEYAASFVPKGPGSEYLFQLKKGDKVEASGPFGRLILKEEPPKRYVFIATSTGITPYRAMIERLKTLLDQNLKAVFLEGVRTENDILYEADFLELAQNYPNQVLFRAYLSRSTQPTLPHHYPGYVQESFADLALDPAADLVYLCGNPAMIDQCFELLKEKGFNPHQIIREKYLSSK